MPPEGATLPLYKTIKGPAEWSPISGLCQHTWFGAAVLPWVVTWTWQNGFLEVVQDCSTAPIASPSLISWLDSSENVLTKTCAFTCKKDKQWNQECFCSSFELLLKRNASHIVISGWRNVDMSKLFWDPHKHILKSYPLWTLYIYFCVQSDSVWQNLKKYLLSSHQTTEQLFPPVILHIPPLHGLIFVMCLATEQFSVYIFVCSLWNNSLCFVLHSCVVNWL